MIPLIGLCLAALLIAWRFPRFGLFGESGQAACRAEAAAGSILGGLVSPEEGSFAVAVWRLAQRCLGVGAGAAFFAAAAVALAATLVTSLTAFHLFGALPAAGAALLMALYLVSRRLEAWTCPVELFLMFGIALLIELSVASLEPLAGHMTLGLSLVQAQAVALAHAGAAGLLAGLLLIWMRRSLALIALLGIAMLGAPPDWGSFPAHLLAYVAGVILVLLAAALNNAAPRSSPRPIAGLLRERLAELRPARRNGPPPRPPELANPQMSWWEPLVWTTLPLAAAALTGLALIVVRLARLAGVASSAGAPPLDLAAPATAMLLAAGAGCALLVAARDRRPSQLLLLLPLAALLAGPAIQAWGRRGAELIAAWQRSPSLAAALEFQPASPSLSQLTIFDGLGLVLLVGAGLALILADVRLWGCRDAARLAHALWGADDPRALELRQREALASYLRQRSQPGDPVVVRGISGFVVLETGRALAAPPRQVAVGREAAPQASPSTAGAAADAPVVLIAPQEDAGHDALSKHYGLPYRLERALDGLAVYHLSTRSLLAAEALRAAGEAERAGAPAAAREAYETALRHDPGYAEAHMGLGCCRLRTGGLESAIEALTAAEQAAPGSTLAAEALFLRGVALVHLERRREGRESLEAAHRLLPVQADILRALAQLEREAENFAAAAVHLRSLAHITTLPSEQRLLAALMSAKCCLEAGDWQGALEVTEKWATSDHAQGHTAELRGILAESRRMQAVALEERPATASAGWG
ncbi:MAG: tetratricopeptide repeat protein [Candidatus Tectomicrobia bacterium]|nr:tetratricopeptide repeat protein [Candidatus Tectomicrobia bacterium]